MVDNFDAELLLFGERCEQCGISNELRMTAFSIMLKGAARQFYFSCIKGKYFTYEEYVKLIRRRFLTPEKTRFLSQKFYSLTLKEVLKQNPARSI